jgi:hypothetical protein
LQTRQRNRARGGAVRVGPRSGCTGAV